MSNPVQKFKFPTAEEITRDWGERCPDVDQDCGCCQMWNTFDLLAAKDAEIAKLREALTPFARIADMEERAGPADSVMVNVARCRDARAALNQGASDA